MRTNIGRIKKSFIARALRMKPRTVSDIKNDKKQVKRRRMHERTQKHSDRLLRRIVDHDPFKNLSLIPAEFNKHNGSNRSERTM